MIKKKRSTLLKGTVKSSKKKPSTKIEKRKKKVDIEKGMSDIAKAKRLSIKRQNHALYMRVWRAKGAIGSLKGKKGFKSKRSALYKKLVIANQEYKKFKKQTGAKVKNKPAFKSRVSDKKAKVISYGAKVWGFEGILSQYISEKIFNQIYLVNIGKVFYVKKNKPSTILMAYDDARDEAYMKPLSSTPIVNVVEDYKESKLSIHIVS